MSNTAAVTGKTERFLLFLKRHQQTSEPVSDRTARLQFVVVAAAWTIVGLLILVAIYLAVCIKRQR
jgi:hypothetical protein